MGEFLEMIDLIEKMDVQDWDEVLNFNVRQSLLIGAIQCPANILKQAFTNGLAYHSEPRVPYPALGNNDPTAKILRS